MVQKFISEKFINIFSNRSTLVSTFIVYITVLFVSVISFIELRKNIIPEITLNFLVILEIHVILNFFLGYLGIYNSVAKAKWINMVFSITAFVVNLFVLYLTLSVLITQTSSFNNYSVLFVITNFILFLQNYFDDRKAKNYFLVGTALAFLFFLIVSVLNFVFGNSLFGTNSYFVSQKQFNDSTMLFSIVYLIYIIFTLFNYIRLYLPDIKNIDQTTK